MRLKLSGFLRACQRLWRYLTWLLKLLMRELKIQLSACLRKKMLLMTRITPPKTGSVHSRRRSAIVLIIFFSTRMRCRKSWQFRLFLASRRRTFWSLRSMKLMMPFPKFFGMFLVSFLSLRSILRRNLHSYESSRPSSAEPSPAKTPSQRQTWSRMLALCSMEEQWSSISSMFVSWRELTVWWGVRRWSAERGSQAWSGRGSGGQSGRWPQTSKSSKLIMECSFYILSLIIRQIQKWVIPPAMPSLVGYFIPQSENKGQGTVTARMMED